MFFEQLDAAALAATPLVQVTNQNCAPGCAPSYQQGQPPYGTPGATQVPTPGDATAPYQPSMPGYNPDGTTSPADSMASPNNNYFSPPDSGALGNPNMIAAAGSNGGYLDIAAPVTQYRLRYDDALGSDNPDRGEYFYAKCGCFKDLGIDPNAKGPSGINTSVNYQAIRNYVEYAFNYRFSVFAEVPVQFDSFSSTFNANTVSPGRTSGIGDMNAGFKYALIARPDEYLTFQFRTYIPTGNSFQGLGTHHVSLEPGFLYYRLLGNRWIYQAQLTDWQGVNVSSYASNVIQYGNGLGYILTQTDNYNIVPTFETVGWTFIGGQTLDPIAGLQSANGATVFNLKPGVRVGFGAPTSPAGQRRQSVYFGWGHAVTSDVLYSDIYRLEYRILF